MTYDENRLMEILNTMDVPEFRKTRFEGRPDLHWFNRNLFIRNDTHPDIKEAYELIKAGLFEFVKKVNNE